MERTYRSLPESIGEAIIELLLHLSQDRTPILVHCAAGKDRTGAVVAIVLDMIGVRRSAILADYEITNLATERLWIDLQTSLVAMGAGLVDRSVWDPVLRADPAYLQAMFEEIDRRWGSSLAFVQQALNVEVDVCRRATDNLLELFYDQSIL